MEAQDESISLSWAQTIKKDLLKFTDWRLDGMLSRQFEARVFMEIDDFFKDVGLLFWLLTLCIYFLLIGLDGSFFKKENPNKFFMIFFRDEIEYFLKWSSYGYQFLG